MVCYNEAMYKAVLFDFGGVIYKHPKEVIPEVLARIYSQPIDITIEEYEEYKNDYFMGKISTEELINSLSSTFRSRKSIEEVKKLWLKYYSELAKPSYEVLDIIKKLHENYKTYLFSNTTEMSNAYNSETGLYDYFDDLFLSYQMGMKKPNPNIYQKVISLIGFKPDECIFIDDDFKNLEPAGQMGTKVIAFNILVDKPAKLEYELKKLRVLT